jgi:hypothetical protein
MGWPAIKPRSPRSKSSVFILYPEDGSSRFPKTTVSYLRIHSNCDTSQNTVFLIFKNIDASNIRRKEVLFIVETMENLFYFRL